MHSLARVTTPRTTKPLTPQCSHCQILSVFSWKLDGPRCYEVGLQTDRQKYHCYRDPPQCVQAEECHCCVLTPAVFDISSHSKVNLNFANINWYVLVSWWSALLSLISAKNSLWLCFPGGRNNHLSLNWRRQS